MFLHSETDVTWARQGLAEEKHLKKNGTYEWGQVRADNHYLDYTVYALGLGGTRVGRGSAGVGGASGAAPPAHRNPRPPGRPPLRAGI